MACAGLACPAGQAALGAEAAVFVPTFVDPHHQVEQPALVARPSIRFLTADDYPPFDFTAPDGSLAGFNIDLARAICGELKVTCSIQARSWDSLVPSLQAGDGDAVIASLAMTAKTREQVDFSTPTAKTPARFAARVGAVPAAVLPETVGTLRIGVQGGTAHAAYLAAVFPAAKVKAYTDPDSLRAGLKSGEVDLMFADGLSTALWLNGTESGECCAFAGGPFTESRFFGDGSGIAVRKGDDELRRALDHALSALSARGVTGDLYLKYFPVGFY